MDSQRAWVATSVGESPLVQPESALRPTASTPFRPPPTLAAEETSNCLFVVNGQVEVPAGGQLKVPTPCG